MVRIVKELQPYKGYPIAVYNGKRYVATDLDTRKQFGADSLKEIKQRVDAIIGAKISCESCCLRCSNRNNI